MAKYGPFRLKKDWRGKRVRLRREATTYGGDRYPAGTVFVVEDTSGAHHGYHLRAPACEHCGHSGSIKLHHHGDMELLEDDDEAPTT